MIQYDPKKKLYYFMLRRDGVNYLFYANSSQEARDLRAKIIDEYEEIVERNLSQISPKVLKDIQKEDPKEYARIQKKLRKAKKNKKSIN